MTLGHHRERVCWTRMQAEAGEGLACIVSRKEMERRAGEGLFFWGIGNAPSKAISSIVGANAAIDVLFSVMKSRPKSSDVSPSKVLLWQHYISGDGRMRPIPAHVLVTSRAGARDHHYALICRSEAPLHLADGGPFDPAAFRNIDAGGAVGASQVTALLERWAPDGPTGYRIAMRAQLSDDLWVKLVNPGELSRAAQTALAQGPSEDDEWPNFVEQIRALGCNRPARIVDQPSLFAV